MTQTQKLREALQHAIEDLSSATGFLTRRSRERQSKTVEALAKLQADIALPTQAEPVQGGEVPCFHINGKVWFRESTNEWVLELSGVINDTNFTVRHTCPPDTKPEDVVDLPNLYPPASQEQEQQPAAQEVGLTDDQADAVSMALRRAWQLGQTYWQQADSDYISQHKKSEETQRKFEKLCDDTIAALRATGATHD